MIVAGVDCGTNTVKLLVADVDPRAGTLTELERCSRMVRLGQGVDATGRLAPEALDRVFTAVEEYFLLTQDHGVEAIRFCATSAARDAENAAEFVRGVEARMGVTPEVLSGAEEAELSFAGATRTLQDSEDSEDPTSPTVEPPILVLDIGGGSTELVLGGGHGEVQAAASLDIGAVRLTERFLADDPPTPDQVEALISYVEAQLDGLPAAGVDLSLARTVVTVSGTGLTVVAGALGLATLQRDLVDRRSVPLSQVRRTIDLLVSLRATDRAALGYVLRGREDVIGAGALILREVLARTPAAELTASVSDILDGITWSVGLR